MIAELFLEGQPLFELSQLLAYRRGQHDPSQHLEKVFPIASSFFVFSLWVSISFPLHLFLSYDLFTLILLMFRKHYFHFQSEWTWDL